MYRRQTLNGNSLEGYVQAKQIQGLLTLSKGPKRRFWGEKLTRSHAAVARGEASPGCLYMVLKLLVVLVPSASSFNSRSYENFVLSTLRGYRGHEGF